MNNLLTRANINQYLVMYLGIDPDEVSLMPDYVKRDLVEDDLDTFREYIDGVLD